jgi:NAD+ synthase
MLKPDKMTEEETAKFIEMADSIGQWLKLTMQESHGEFVVLGMSGGTDSLVVGKIATRTFGADKVIGVFLPNGVQPDLDDAHSCAAAAGITRTLTINIHDDYQIGLKQIELIKGLGTKPLDSRQAEINLAPRIRMGKLYMVAQTLGEGRVLCTGNFSEALVGYCTLWGDLAGDMAPIGTLFKQDVCKLGMALGLPEHLVYKAPSDGLSGKTD